MRVKVNENAAQHYVARCYRHANPQCGKLHNEEYEAMLQQVQGQWLEVETEHLFRDQFNTGPVPGVSEHGLRLTVADVTEIEDDVRAGVIKCDWCFGYDHDKDGKCDKCGKTDFLRPLDPISPVSLEERVNAKTRELADALHAMQR